MKQILGLIGFIIILSGCSSSPNDISTSISQGVCAQTSMYSVGTAAQEPAILESMPQTAPYCMAVTVQNRNSGQNANNIQPIGSGVQISYTAGSSSFSGSLYDPASVGFTIGGFSQTVGNIIMFDPYNCATVQGGNVATIPANGGSCTYYLAITGESFPVGVYPTSLTYNYTNGNANYTTSANFNQRVDLFAGGPSGLYQLSNNQWVAGPTTSNNKPIGGVTNLARDLFGNIYIATANAVYEYNGITTSQLGTLANNLTINSITTDNNGYLYAATNNGIYTFIESSNIWSLFTDTSNKNFIGISSYQYLGASTNIIYATESATAYYCLNPGLANCSWLPTTASIGVEPSTFYLNSIYTDSNGNLYTGNLYSTNQFYTQNTWSAFSILPAISGTVLAINWAIGSNATPYVYLGENPNQANLSTESAVYICNLANLQPANCTPLISSAGNSLLGNIYDIAGDGGGNIYAVGANINSADFTVAGPYSGSFITTAGSTATTAWTPISSSNDIIIGSGLTTLKISSMLTSY